MHFEVEKYLGIWYELIKYPTALDLTEDYNTTAEYGLAANGTVIVHNSTMVRGQIVEAYGEALVEPLTYFKDGMVSIASFKILFPGETMTLEPNYCIRYLFTNEIGDYLYAVVSNPELDSLHVLSRFPNPDLVSFNVLLSYLAKDFDLSRIVHVPHFQYLMVE